MACLFQQERGGGATSGVGRAVSSAPPCVAMNDMRRSTLLRDASATLGLADRVVCAAASFEQRAPHLGDTSGSSSSSTAMPASSRSTVVSRDSGALTYEEALAARLFLAAKMCEEPRRLRDVLNAVELATRGDIVRDAHDYWDRKAKMVTAEQLVLRELGFDTSFEDAQVLLLNSLRLFRAPKALYELSVSLLNDTMHTLHELRTSRVLVAAAICVGAELLGLPLPAGWHGVLEVETSVLATACHAVLDVYDRQETPSASAGTAGGARSSM